MACVSYFAHPFEVLASEYAGIDHPNLTCQIGAMKQANAPRPTRTRTHAPNHTHAHPAVRTRARIRQRAHLMCTHAHKTQVRAESAPDSVGALQLPLPLRSKFDTQPRSTYNETHQIQCTGLLVIQERRATLKQMARRSTVCPVGLDLITRRSKVRILPPL
jgi:hypothetical protein